MSWALGDGAHVDPRNQGTTRSTVECAIHLAHHPSVILLLTFMFPFWSFFPTDVCSKGIKTVIGPRIWAPVLFTAVLVHPCPIHGGGKALPPALHSLSPRRGESGLALACGGLETGWHVFGGSIVLIWVEGAHSPCAALRPLWLVLSPVPPPPCP